MMNKRANIIRDETGVAATEFALLLPVLMALVLGVYEISRYILLHQKIERVAYTVADVVGQQTSVTNAGLSDIVAAASKIMDPYDFEQNGVVIVTSVYQDPDDGPVVRWQYKGGGVLDRESRIGASGDEAELPNGLTLNESDNVIFAEIFYNYIPDFDEDYFDDRENYKYAVFKPRLGALTTAPN